MVAKVDERLRDRDMAMELRPAAKDLLPSGATTRCWGPAAAPTIQREIEDSLYKKIWSP